MSDGRETCSLLCPVCESANGKWSIYSAKLFASGTTLYKRKRCKRCRTRVLYKAWKTEEGIAINSVLDKKVQKDIAELHKVSPKEVAEALKDAQDKEGTFQWH